MSLIRFFGISPAQANWIDPQARKQLEVVYGAFEDAGYINQMRASDTAIYTGICFQEYWDEIIRKQIPLTGIEHPCSHRSSAAAQISFTLDMQGASIPLDNACASSLSALHLACQALKTGECKLALATGVNLLISPLQYVYFSRVQAMSPTGRCHTFDKSADGFVAGEGILAVLLKPLSKAIRDEDNIHGIIKSTAVNHVGRSTNAIAPRPELQTKLVLNAWEKANIDPETVSYIECHGTGTKLGDPIEINALKKAFKQHTSKKDFCALGSVKAHIGHLEGAAGLAGVVKVLLSMKHKIIPKMPTFKELNPIIQLKDSPFYINTETLEWRRQDSHPLRAGVSSFGMTGNNAHVIVEEYIPEKQPIKMDMQTFLPVLIVLSAKNEEQLIEHIQRLLSRMEEGLFSEKDLPDIAYTLQIGREAMEERLAIIVSSIDVLKEKLKTSLDLRFINRGDKLEDIYYEKVKRNQMTSNRPQSEASHLKDLSEWARLWVKGGA